VARDAVALVKAFVRFVRGFRKVDCIVAGIVFVVAFAMLASLKVVHLNQMLGDSAMFFQGTENLASRGVPFSQVQAAIVNYLDLNNYLTEPIEQIVKEPQALFGRPTPVAERSLLLGHPYFILYPIALLVKVFPVRDVLLGLYAFSFTGMVLLAYLVLRHKNVSIPAACLFCLLIISHPVWWEGLLWGQFYPDRLFILAGFVFILVASRNTTAQGATYNKVWLFIAAALCASINERGALVAGIFLISYAILYWKQPGLARNYNLILGIGLACYGSVEAYAAANPSTHTFFTSMFRQPNFVHLVSLFMLVNAPLLLLALFEWRAAAIAAILMLPNILGDIGGAEKTGWSTHYPTFYFPSLVWAGLIGYSALYRKAVNQNRLPALYAATLGCFLFLVTLNPDSANTFDVTFSNAANSFLPRFKEEARLYLFEKTSRRFLKSQLNGIDQAVPPHTEVSSIESGMPILYRDRTIEYFPQDIDHADYAVLSAQKTDGKIVYDGALTYLGPVAQKQLNDIVLARMRADGYDLDHPTLFPAVGIAVVKRRH
jgi:hypothetical protein